MPEVATAPRTAPRPGKVTRVRTTQPADPPAQAALEPDRVDPPAAAKPRRRTTTENEVPRCLLTALYEPADAVDETAWAARGLEMYLYRLDPPVNNRENEPSNIGVFVQPVNEQQIKDLHGGGKYKAWLRSTRERDLSLTYKFRIEGKSKLLEGQLVIGPDGKTPVQTSAPAAAAPDDERLASVIKLVLENTQGKSLGEAQQIAMDLMKTGFQNALQVTKEAAASQPVAPNPMAQMKDMLELARMLKPEPSALEKALTAKVVERLAGVDEEERPQQRSILAELKEVGIDPAGLLGGRKGGGLSDWATIVSKAVDAFAPAVPRIMERWAAIRQAELERDVAVAKITRGVLDRRSAAAVPPPRIERPHQPAAATVEHQQQSDDAPQLTEEQQMQILENIGDIVANVFVSGESAEAAVFVIDQVFPGVRKAYQAMLGNRIVLEQLVQRHKRLAEISKDADWPEFFAEFVTAAGRFEEDVQNEGGSGSSPAAPVQ